MEEKDEPQNGENNSFQPKDCYRIILTDEDENDLRIEETDEEKVDDFSEIGNEPGCSNGNHDDDDEEGKKSDKGGKKKKRGKKRKDAQPSVENGANHSILEKKKEKLSSSRKLKRSDFNCHHCKYISSWKTNLEKHMMAQHTGERPFKCPYCEYSSVHQFQLEKHFNSRHSGSMLNCEQCEFSTSLIDAYYKHTLSSHPTEKPYKCPECGKRSITLTALELHVLDKHNKLSRLNKCQYCSYSTVLPDNLKSHIEALHKCSDCDFRSDSLRDVRRHKKIEHRLQTKCDECDHVAKGPQYLKRHKIAKHNPPPVQNKTNEKKLNSIKVSSPKLRKTFHILNPPPPPKLNIEVNESPSPMEDYENHVRTNSLKIKNKFAFFNQSNSSDSSDDDCVTTPPPF